MRTDVPRKLWRRLALNGNGASRRPFPRSSWASPLAASASPLARSPAREHARSAPHLGVFFRGRLRSLPAGALLTSNVRRVALPGVPITIMTPQPTFKGRKRSSRAAGTGTPRPPKRFISPKGWRKNPSARTSLRSVLVLFSLNRAYIRAWEPAAWVIPVPFVPAS